MYVVNRIKKKYEFYIRRKNNLKHAYDFPAQRDGWVKYELPLIGGKDTYFDPYVRQMGDKMVMFVSHRDSGGIVRMESEDGLNWSVPIQVLNGKNGSMWEPIVNRASILKKDERWLMWYTGQTKKASAIGLAESDDGIHFRRCSDRPVLTADSEYEKESVMNPCVIWNQNTQEYNMWYSAGEIYEPDVICYASSKDGYTWIKYKNNPVFTSGEKEYDKAKVGGCDIIRDSTGQYIMFYIGYQNIDTARICVAVSNNGIDEWKRIDQNPILSPTKGSWDRHAVYKPTVVLRDKERKIYLWYNGRYKHQESIGLAVRNYDREMK